MRSVGSLPEPPSDLDSDTARGIVAGGDSVVLDGLGILVIAMLGGCSIDEDAAMVERSALEKDSLNSSS
jgi:hypothetical protein